MYQLRLPNGDGRGDVAISDVTDLSISGTAPVASRSIADR